MTTLIWERSNYPSWRCGFCEEKLLIRGQLPGASIFDRVCNTFRDARQKGMTAFELLPAAMPASWMVNNTVTSPAFQQWLQPEMLGHWQSLLELLPTTPQAWLDCSTETRDAIDALLQKLFLPKHGAVGLSKVLALLVPDLVPLMDDAAIWFGLGTLDYPKNATTPTSQPSHFLPMLDWFAAAVLTHQELLAQLAAVYPLCDFRPTQVLDRLLWFESWGYHIMPGPPFWRWVVAPEFQAIVPVGDIPPSSRNAPTEILPLADIPEEWRDATLECLEVAYE